jgi:hypothetical protein
MSQKTDEESGHDRPATDTGPRPPRNPADAAILSSAPAGYEAADRVVTVRSTLAEVQFRTIERILEHPHFWLGRHKAWAEMYVFTTATPAIAEALCTYLRDQTIPHEYETTYRWLGSGA